MKIAVVGSREGFTYEDVSIKLDGIINVCEDSIISGGARGVDTYAEKYSKQNLIPMKIIKPIDPSKKLDYIFRNIEIICEADKIIAFHDGLSRGTKFVIYYAKARNKKVIIFDKPQS